MLLRLDGRGPRYAQITRALSAAIQDGRLKPGARLPSTRTLAEDLGCARNVVLLAYEQLLLEGYLATRHGGGTYVALDLATAERWPATARGGRPVRLSVSGQRMANAADRARGILPMRSSAPIDFIYGVCQPDDRTVVALRTAFAASLRGRTFAYASPGGDKALREALASRLLGARGIRRDAGRIVVTSGAQQAVDICARLLLDPGDRVVIEDPGYSSAQAIFEAAGATVMRVPVDRHGLDVSQLPTGRRRVRLIYVTPSHQFPTGAVLPIARRYALLEWARNHGAYVIEDDYDGEFRYTGRPIEAVAALDGDGPVIYCGTFAKALFPAMRLAFLSLPPELVTPVRQAKWIADSGSSLLLQRTVAHLMESGAYERHIRRMTRRYRARRDVLLDAVQTHFGNEATVDGSGAGLHVVVWLPALRPARVPDLITRCAARGVAVYSLAPHATTPTRAGLVLGYGMLEPEQIRNGIRCLADEYRYTVSSRSAAARNVSSFLAKQNRRTGPPRSL